MQNSSHLTTKILPPFGEEGPSANEHAGFQLKQDHMLKCDTMLTKHYLFVILLTELFFNT